MTFCGILKSGGERYDAIGGRVPPPAIACFYDTAFADPIFIDKASYHLVAATEAGDILIDVKEFYPRDLKYQSCLDNGTNRNLHSY